MWTRGQKYHCTKQWPYLPLTLATLRTFPIHLAAKARVCFKLSSTFVHPRSIFKASCCFMKIMMHPIK